MPVIAISPIKGRPSVAPPIRAAVPGIPWTTASQWSAVNDSLGYFKGTHGGRLAAIFRMAAELDAALDSLNAMAARLALCTCRFCPEPCCATATPWYDLADLLLSHFGGVAIPAGQPVARYGGHCRYLGPAGCRLPRLQRPWICTWYTCPVQRSALARTPHRHRKYIALTAAVKMHRQRMERWFIDITAGKVSGGG